MNAELLSIGTELLLGDILNTNARFLSKQLSGLGINLYYQTTVGDNRERLLRQLRESLERSELIITSGGLGPTEDDLTCATVCEALGLEQVEDEETTRRIRVYFENLGREMPDSNLRQAMVPKGAAVFANDHGTAPGCAVKTEKNIVILLPGPPAELEPMFTEKVLPYLREMTNDVIVSHSIRLFGVGESRAAEDISDLTKGSNPTAATYAKAGEVEIRITARAKTEEQANQIILPVQEDVCERFGGDVYGIDCDSLEQRVVGLLTEQKKIITTAESCTGGLLSKRITDVPGASAVFRLGTSTYSGGAKRSVLGVKRSVLEKHGEVSPETAASMAVGIRKRTGADIGVGITGIAGPGGGTPEKPVGLIYVSVTDGRRVWTHTVGGARAGDRDYNRLLTSSTALDMVRRVLTEEPEFIAEGVPVSKSGARVSYMDPFRTEKFEEVRKKSRLRRLFEWYIPQKGDGVGFGITKAVRILATFVLIGCLVYLGDYGWQTYKASQLEKQWSEITIAGLNDPDTTAELPADLQLPEGMNPNFAQLWQQNQDVKGWIEITGTQLRGPVVQSSDNDYYLHNDFMKQRNICGALFLDYRCKIEPKALSKNTIIYGHYVNNGTMFGSLFNYKKLDYYKQNPVINFSTIYDAYQWKIFSVMIVDSRPERGDAFPYLTTQFANDESFMAWVEQVQRRSMYNTSVDVRADDEILTLSTCTYEFEDARLVVVARKVRAGEDPTVNVSSAVNNPIPLYPDEYYRKVGGQKPVFPDDPQVVTEPAVQDPFSGGGTVTPTQAPKPTEVPKTNPPATTSPPATAPTQNDGSTTEHSEVSG